MNLNSCACLTAAAVYFALLMPSVGLQAGETAEQSEGSPPFYAFCFDTHDAQKRSLEEQAAMLKQLGFDGAGHIGLENIRQHVDDVASIITRDELVARWKAMKI